MTPEETMHAPIIVSNELALDITILTVKAPTAPATHKPKTYGCFILFFRMLMKISLATIPTTTKPDINANNQEL